MSYFFGVFVYVYICISSCHTSLGSLCIYMYFFVSYFFGVFVYIYVFLRVILLWGSVYHGVMCVTYISPG